MHATQQTHERHGGTAQWRAIVRDRQQDPSISGKDSGKRTTYEIWKRPQLTVGLLGSIACTAIQAATSPSTSVDPYLTSHLPGVTIESILTVDDGTVPKTGGGNIGMVDIPDGIGVIDGNELAPA